MKWYASRAGTIYLGACIKGGGPREGSAGAVRAPPCGNMEFEIAIGNHTFRAPGITNYLTNGGLIEVPQRMARHSNAILPRTRFVD